ncbi:hypothetical protein QBC35DRAFT_197324 [Podospora australis]|uniref:Uncharacterized protein n=1 Tax=Podospora australis TaxID=1536484 RepID=A0AAN6X4C1_9PEZI|nr:hypothetical protein QBC35DRAFT_197324 [Podospora australis]
MHSSRFQSITARFSPHNLRTSFRRSSSASTSSRASSGRSSFVSQASSPVDTINTIVFRQKSSMDLGGDEKDEFVLEPRPAATFCSLEARMSSF